MLGRLWQRRTAHHASKQKGKNKERGAENDDDGEHEMARMPRPPATKVSMGRDKPRVLAAGDDPRARFRSQAAEPESDEERDSPTSSMDHHHADSHSSSDEESEHGLVDTICYCLCLPCCK